MSKVVICVCVSVTLLDHVESCHMCVCECYATGSCRKLSYVCVCVLRYWIMSKVVICVCVSVTLLDHVESCHMCVCECYATGSCRKLSYVCV